MIDATSLNRHRFDRRRHCGGPWPGL